MHSHISRQTNIDKRMGLVNVSTTATDQLNRKCPDFRFCIRPTGIVPESVAVIDPQTGITGDKDVGNPRIAQMRIEMTKHQLKVGKKSISRDFFCLFGAICTPFAPVEDKAYVSEQTGLTWEGDTCWGERCRLRGARLGESAAPPVRYEALNYSSVRHK